MAFGTFKSINKDGVCKVEFTGANGQTTTFTGKLTVRPGGMVVFEPGVEPDVPAPVLTPEKVAAGSAA